MKIKKLLALLLCLCLAVALLPGMAAALTPGTATAEPATRTFYVGINDSKSNYSIDYFDGWQVLYTTASGSGYAYCSRLDETSQSSGSIYVGETIIVDKSGYVMFAAEIPADTASIQVCKGNSPFGAAGTLDENINCAYVESTTEVWYGTYTPPVTPPSPYTPPVIIPPSGGSDPTTQTVYVGVLKSYEENILYNASFNGLNSDVGCPWYVHYTTGDGDDSANCYSLGKTYGDSGNTLGGSIFVGVGNDTVFNMYAAQIPAGVSSIQVYRLHVYYGGPVTLGETVNCAFVRDVGNIESGFYSPSGDWSPDWSDPTTQTVYVGVRDTGGPYNDISWRILYTTADGRSGYGYCRTLETNQNIGTIQISIYKMYATDIPLEAESIQVCQGSIPFGEAGTLENGVNCAYVESRTEVWYGTYTPLSWGVPIPGGLTDPIIVTHMPPDNADTNDSDDPVTMTRIVTNPDGSETEIATSPDGSRAEETTLADGTSGTVFYDADGKAVSMKAGISEKAVSDAAEKGTPVTLPITAEAGGLPVTVTLPKDAGPVAVEIPAENLTPGTAAVIVHEDGTEELVRASVNGEKGVLLKIDGSATVKIIDNTKTFPDVPPGSLSEPYITWAASRGLFLGTEDGFEPGADMTRGMLATVLYRLDGSADVGENSFGDVPEGMWFTDAVTWAGQAGITTGTGEGFEPNAPVTREQTAVMLYRYANFLGLDTGSRASPDDFPDSGLCENWAKDAMSWAVSAGLFPDSGDGALDPGGITTRAEAAEMIYRLAEIIVKQV